MQFLIILFGAAILLLGLSGVLSSSAFVAILQRFNSRAGFYTASAARVVFAALLWFGAPISKYPTVLEVLAIVSLVAAVILQLIGLERYQKLVGWLLDLGEWPIRLAGAFALAFGVFIIWLVI